MDCVNLSSEATDGIIVCGEAKNIERDLFFCLGSEVHVVNCAAHEK